MTSNIVFPSFHATSSTTTTQKNSCCEDSNTVVDEGPFQSLHYICSLPFRYVDYMVPILLLYKEYNYWVSSPIVSHRILENNAFSITCTMAMEMECFKNKTEIFSYFLFSDRRQFQEKYKQLAFGKKARKRNINHQNSNNDAVLAKSFWIFHPLFILHYGLSQSINKTLMVPNFQPTRLFGFLLFSNAFISMILNRMCFDQQMQITYA